MKHNDDCFQLTVQNMIGLNISLRFSLKFEDCIHFNMFFQINVDFQ